MNVYQQMIHKSRYARFLDEKNRREHWPETIDRYLDFVFSSLNEKYKFSDPSLRKEIFSAIHDMKVMPSMRAMMSAGKAAEKDNTAMYNCFSGDTEIITKQGPRRLIDLLDKSTEVMTNDGWKKAKINSFGKQNVNLVSFRPSTSKSKIRHHLSVTGNHRWLTLNRGWVTDLKIGDSVSSCVARITTTLYNEAWIRGFGFGDGTIDNTGSARIRLCGSKIQHLQAFQLNGSCWTQELTNGDIVLGYNQKKFSNWKILPYEYLDNIEYLSSWLQGYMAADGHTGNQPGLSSQNYEAIEFIEKIAPSCGYVITGKNISSVMETNFGTRKHPLCRLTIRKETVFYVTNIEELDEQEVYCVTEPVTSTFALANGILTGNCSYVTVDDVKAFDEAMVILMNGTGLGFSVERQYVNKLPEIPDKLYESDTTIIVKDSKEGWGKAFRQLLALLYSGEIPKWDLSKLRPAGARLRVFGGRSSGPAPLDELFKFVVRIFRNAIGRKLTSLECHDIMCKIGEVVVVGGVRRSALISLSNLSDDRMRNAKHGAWWDSQPQRSLSNNSAVYTEKPEIGAFMAEWLALYESKSGERGIIGRGAMKDQVARNGRRETEHEWGCNPCSEIILRPNEFCNLSEVIIRAEDTAEVLKDKVRIATIIGTFQSTFTYFPYLRKTWTKNVEEERLLGVSLTGIYDNKLLNNYKDKNLSTLLQELRQVAIDTNKKYADILGIPVSAAITCIKPSGTVSELTDTASGIHPRHAKHYIRRVRSDNKDPLTQYMINAGVPSEPDVMRPHSTSVFSFVKNAPKGALLKEDISAVDHLELWLMYQRHWCEHKPSVTISVKEDEWLHVGAWVYKNFDEMTGVSFLPYDGGTYRQAPYEEIDKDKYEEIMKTIPTTIDWTGFSEVEDLTEGTQTLACTGAGGCDL